MDQSATPQILSNDPRQRPASRLAEVLLIVLVFFALAGDPTPHQNEPYYLCRLKHFWNPAWCAGDFFLDSPDAHATFVWTFGWVTKWLSLPATAWAGRLLVWTLLAWAWQRLSWRVVPRPLFSVLSAALWVVLIDRGNLAGEWVVGGFESKCVAYVFDLLALYELANAHWNRVWLFLGAASAFHVLVGGWSVIVCAGIWLLDTPSHQNNPKSEIRNPKSRALLSTLFSRLTTIPSILPGLIGGGLLALFGVVPALRLTWHQPPDLVTEANRIYVFDRLPHHLSVLTVPADEVVRRLTRHGLVLAACALVAWANYKMRSENSSAAKTLAGAPLSRITMYGFGAALLAAVGLIIELLLWNEPVWAAALLRYYWFRLTDVAVPLALALNVVALIAGGFAKQRRWAALALFVALFAAAWPLIMTVHERSANPVPPCDSGMASYNDWVDVCQWVADNAPSDAIFLTPRGCQSFKWRTGRREVVTRKDIPQDARGIVEWSDRLHNIYYYKVDDQLLSVDSLADLGIDHATAMAKKYGADFILANREPLLKLSIEYANNTYVVYRTQH